MKKLFLLVFISWSFIYADINFKEIRYMSALDFERDFYGSISIQEDIFSLEYERPVKQKITYYEDKLVLLKDEKESTYLFSQYPQMQYMGMIVKSIMSDDFNSLDELFKVSRKEGEILLEPKASIQNTIDFITIVKKDKKVERISIDMSNKDKITIELSN